MTMSSLYAQPSPELGLDLVRDVVDVRRLPRWDPRYWGHIALEDEPRCAARFRALGLSWAKARAHARAQATAAELRTERLLEERKRERQLPQHELSLKPKHAVARPCEGTVPALISGGSACVVAAIDLHHEAGGGRTEIHDEATEHDLPPEAHAELLAANGLPQALFRRRERSAHSGRASGEQLSASELEFLFFQKSLLVPAKWPGVAPSGAGSVTRARRIARSVTARGAERAPLREAWPLRRDEACREQLSTRVHSVSSHEPTQTRPVAQTQQSLSQDAGAPPRRADLPHSRAARAGLSQLALLFDALRLGAGEHEFGEGRAPAGGIAAEDARVGAPPQDYRTAEEWPAGSKPVTKKIRYDDLYRATRIDYQAAGGSDAWTSPFAAELAGQTDPRRAVPGAHVAFDSRPLYQTFSYDWLGNTQSSDDDAHGFYDRSLGTITNDVAGGHPYQLKSANNKSGPATTRNGQVDVAYDAMGNISRVNLERNGPCLPAGSPCSSRWDLQYDEVGRLSRIFRADMPTASLPPIGSDGGAMVRRDLRFLYDENDERIVKSSTDTSGVSTSTLYPYETLEVRGTAIDTSQGYADTSLTADNEVPYLVAHGVRLARVDYEESAKGEPRVGTTGASQHVLFELGDQLGSTDIVIDKATSELVEASTYQGYGAKESDYRPERWKGYRDDYGFTGKEEDAEFGIVYFGKRFYSPALNRWITADPLAVHSPGQADLNLYAYVRGAVLRLIDRLGLDPEDGIPPPRDDNGKSLTPVATVAIGPVTVVTGAAATAKFQPQPAGRGDDAGKAVIGLLGTQAAGAAKGVGTTAGVGTLGVLCPPCGMAALGYGAYKTLQRVGEIFSDPYKLADFTGQVAGGAGVTDGVLPEVPDFKLEFQGLSRSSTVDTPKDEGPGVYAGVREASAYLRDQGVPRAVRKSVLESFDVRTLKVEQAGAGQFGLRFYDGVNAGARGRYLFETFPAGREGLALRPEWNQMTYIQQFQVRPGATFFRGSAAPQGAYYPGGQSQLFVPDLGDLF